MSSSPWTISSMLSRSWCGMRTSRLAWPSSVSLYFVSRLAAEQVKVVLTGEGSDELFGGYARYRFYQLNQRWMNAYRGVPAACATAFGMPWRHIRCCPPISGENSDTLCWGATPDIESLYLDNFYCAFGAEEQKKILVEYYRNSPYANF